MWLIRTAKTSDREAVQHILDELDLAVPSQKLDNFWVAEATGKIAGIARLEDFGNYLFLSCVGVKKTNRRKGIASALLNELLASAKKAIYLYTVIPDFFKKFGFKPVALSPLLPSKENLVCQECFPEKCQTMVKLPDVSKIPEF